MSPLAAALATTILFFVPGTLIVALLNGEDRVRLSFGEQLYLTIAGSFLVSGWVALALTEVSRYTPLNAAGAVAILALVGWALTRRRLRFAFGAWDAREIAVVAALLGFTLVAYFPPFEYILGGRDPGIYVNTGFHVAREGNLKHQDPLIGTIPKDDRALFFRVDKDIPDWSHLRFQGYALENPDTAEVVPHGLHLYPTWIGITASLFETKAGLYATPFFAMLGALGWFFAMRRLFGMEVAIWTSALLTGFQIQTWFARFPNSEVVVQFLFVVSLLTFYFAEEKRSTIAGIVSGMALGATLLARMENILFLAPVGVFFGWKRLTGKLEKPEIGFLGGFAVLAVHAALHDRFVSWPYVSSILGRHYWSFLGENLWWVAAVGIAFLVIADWAGRRVPSGIYRAIVSNEARLIAAIGLFALAAFTYFVRPFWHGPRTAPHDAEALFRMSWYLYPVGLALAISGAMMLLVRAKKAQAFFLLTGLTFSLFFFYKVRVWHDHYFAMRRFIPVILPTLIACISLFLVELRWDSRRLIRWGSRLVAAILLVIYVNDGRKLWATGGHEEFVGSLDFVEELARHIGDEDVVIFPRREGLHMLELPLAELHGKNVLEFYSLKPPRDQLEDLLVQWRDVYGDVFFVTNYKVSLSGLFTRHVKDFWFATEKYEFGYTHAPTGAEPFHLRFTLSKAVDLDELAERVPPLPDVDVGGSDDLQVSWFHEKELDEAGTSYRWSQRISSIFLPAIGEGTRYVDVTLASAADEGAPISDVEILVDDEIVTSVTPGSSFQTYTIELPRALIERAPATYSILTLRTPTWRPSSSLPEATDVRDLGVRVTAVHVR